MFPVGNEDDIANKRYGYFTGLIFGTFPESMTAKQNYRMHLSILFINIVIISSFSNYKLKLVIEFIWISTVHLSRRVGLPYRTATSDLNIVYRGSYMSAYVLLNLLNELGKRDKMRGLPSILSPFRNEFNKFNKTRVRMLDSIYHMTNTLKSHFWRKNV